jgi:choloylglycine hydrolase
MSMKRTIAGLTAIALSQAPAATACTGISLATTGGEHVQARTIEWGNFNLNSKLIVSSQGHSYTSKLPENKDGLTWESKYGFVGISVYSDALIGEGMNEAGLNAGLFFFPHYGSLKPYDPNNTSSTIADMDFVRWLLSQFATVEEVKANLDKVTLAPIFIQDGQPSPTAHWRVSDKSGGNIVIEITDGGQINVYDNEVGVLTNAPDFPWMVTNLNNYVNVSPGTIGPREVDGHQLFSFGAGTASRSLPGDISPPSRFVRAWFYKSTTPPMKSSIDAVSQAFHILDNFDLPIGIEFSANERDKIPDIPSATQWTAASDLSAGEFFYKTMYDSTVKRVDLNKIDFTGGDEKSYALDNGTFHVEDATP